jgi:hypothetical protein
MKNAVFWDVAPCSPFANRRLGGTGRGRVFITVMWVALVPTHTPVRKRTIQHHIPENGILQTAITLSLEQ